MKDLILVIDDEEDLLELLEYRLGEEGFEVIGALGSKSARKILQEENVSLMLVDRNLGLEEGSEFVKSIRKEGYNVPVIYLSAKDSQEDKITGFQRGGDDYITKPFVFEELIARISAVLRRYKGVSEDKIWKYKNLTLYPKTHLLFIANVGDNSDGGDDSHNSDDEKKIQLTPLETKMLLVFLKNTGIVLSRDYLLEEIWNKEGESKSVNVAIKRLREKLDVKNEERFIKAIRGEGYVFV